MIHTDLVRRGVGVLDGAGIAYMVTGSVASSTLGEPRMTHDVDVVVELDRRHVAALLAAFAEPDYYVDEAAIRDAISHDNMFNVIDNTGVGKVDFRMLKDQPLDQRAFSRRRLADIAGFQTSLPRPEDLILLKLRWAKLCGGSETQMKDCRGLLRVCKSEIDLAETEHWALRAGVSDQWAELRRFAGV